MKHIDRKPEKGVKNWVVRNYESPLHGVRILASWRLRSPSRIVVIWIVKTLFLVLKRTFLGYTYSPICDEKLCFALLASLRSAILAIFNGTLGEFTFLGRVSFGIIIIIFISLKSLFGSIFCNFITTSSKILSNNC